MVKALRGIWHHLKSTFLVLKKNSGFYTLMFYRRPLSEKNTNYIDLVDMINTQIFLFCRDLHLCQNFNKLHPYSVLLSLYQSFNQKRTFAALCI
jgi:hypothetical protein